MKIKLFLGLLAVWCGSAQASFKVSEKFLDALEHVESGRKPNAKGDKIKGDYYAIGSMQLWEIYVREANRILKYPVFAPGDRTDPLASREMARVVLNYWGRYFERKGVKITPAVLCSLHRQPCAGWKAKNMNSKLERGRAKKLLRHMSR